MINNRLKGISLFASAGIGETYFKDAGIDIMVSNELLERRAELYKAISPETTVVCGDITKDAVFEKGATFRVAVAPTARPKEGDLEFAVKYLKLALAENGVGAKTAAGYGWFEIKE